MTMHKDHFECSQNRQGALMAHNEMAMQTSLERLHDSQALNDE